MSTAFFDGTGRLMLIADIAGMSPPERSVYAAEVVDATVLNDIYFDIVSDAVAEKSDLNLTIERNRLSNIPAGTRAIFNGNDVIVDDGEIDFEANVDETTSVFLDNLKFKSQVVEVQTGP